VTEPAQVGASEEVQVPATAIEDNSDSDWYKQDESDDEAHSESDDNLVEIADKPARLQKQLLSEVQFKGF
jgi:hypothetical protein